MEFGVNIFVAYVNIVLSDKGWILERLAKEISKRLPYCKYGLDVDPLADIQYYVTYSTWKTRVSKVEVGYFAHLEVDKITRQKFFDVAQAVDYSICHSRLYENVLREHGVVDVTTISPGVDLDELRPVTKIGVVGRTYHTGRKGETLVRQVMDVPGIEWHFTGEGWPGSARKIPHGQMGDFYNEMDYVLVPALYEGGPMSVAEALACGCEVIAPPIGWVSEFPHIEYRTGDAEDLRRVLEGLVKRKQELRDTVLERTWDAWAEGHDRLFRNLVIRHGLTPLENVAATQSPIGPVALVLHGDEGKALGGPSVRVPNTVNQLRRIGYDAALFNFPDPELAQAQLIHGFNVWSPVSGRQLARRAAEDNKPFVLSSIFLDLSEREFWQERLLALFASEKDPENIDVELRRLRARFLRDAKRGLFSTEGMPGHHQRVREMVGQADHVILLSEFEKQALASIGAVPKAATVVHNPVDGEKFGNADPDLFAETYGVRDYILCVARIEPRKNQLMILHALRDLDLPIVFIGHGTNREYNALLERYAADNVHFVGRIAPDDPLIPSAISGCRVFTLPSWSEGAPLAALEAGVAGASMVLSDRSSEQEYFGNLARYCDPSSPESIRSAILEAYNNPLTIEEKSTLKRHVEQHFSWEVYARKTADVYEDVMAVRLARTPPVVALEDKPKRRTTKSKRIALDVTTSCNHKGRWTGISRSEMCLAHSLRQDKGVEVSFIAWHNGLRRFIDIPEGALDQDYLSVYFQQVAHQDPCPVMLRPDDDLIVCGSAWMQNSTYAEQVVELSNSLKLRLSFVVHDVIPTKFPFWFDEKYAPAFERNLSLMLSRSNHIFAVSNNTAKDVLEFAAKRHLEIPAPKIYHQGSDIGFGQRDPDALPSANIVELFSSKKFILSVGAIHSRKNHRLLYDIWVSLAEEHGRRCPHLVIVGGVAWNGTDVARAFREDKRLQGLVHIVEGIDDVTLDWLYDNCLFTVYPSLYEGWGLPVAESLFHGKICIASDTSSVPEICPSATDLVNPQDFQAWRSRVNMYFISTAARAARENEIREAYKPLTWRQATSVLLADLRDAVPQRPAGMTYTLGTTLKLTGADAAIAKRGGWHVTESWGVWSSAPKAGIGLRLSEPAQDDLILGIQARALAQEGKPVRCDVQVNDVAVGRLSFHGGAAAHFSLLIPREVAGSGTEMDIAFHNTALVSPRTLKPDSTDVRSLGIGVSSISVSHKTDFRVAGKTGDASGSKLPLCLVDQQIRLIDNPKAAAFFTSAIISDFQWGVRPVSGPLQVVLNVQEHFGRDLTLVFRYRACATPDRPLRALITDGLGNVLGQFEAFDDCLNSGQIDLPWSIRKAASPVVVSFSYQKIASPADLAIGHLHDALGLGLFGLVIQSGLAQVLDDNEDEEAILLPFDGVIDFQRGRGGRRFVDASTWHNQEDAGFWSIGRRGRIVIGLDRRPDNDFRLELKGAPLVPVEVGNDVAVFINGVAQHVAIFSDETGCCVAVEASVESLDGTWSDTPTLNIEIITALEDTPFRYKGSADDRVLGFFLKSLAMTDVDSAAAPLPFDQWIDLSPHEGEGVPVARYLETLTWHGQEIDGFWSRGLVGRMLLPLKQRPSVDFTLSILGSTFIPLEEGNEIEIFVNGVLQVSTVSQAHFQYRIDVRVSLESLEGSWEDRPELSVDIKVAMSGQPSARDESGDNRDLGFFLRSFFASDEAHAEGQCDLEVEHREYSAHADVLSADF